MKSVQYKAADHGDSHYIERITDAGRIAWMLTQLMEKRELLTICLANNPDKFTSSIVDIDSKTGQVNLDELMPRTGNKLMAKKRSLQVSGRLDGINLDFILVITGTGMRDGLVFIAADLPDTVNYQQRRDTHRVRLPLIPDLFVTLVAGDNSVEEGLLRDISHGGAQVILKSGSGVIPVSMLYECAIELPAGLNIYCTIEVRYFMPVGKHADIRAGIRFLDLTPYQQRAIDRCVASVEMEQIRKRAL